MAPESSTRQVPHSFLLIMYTNIFCRNVRGFNIRSHRSGFKKWFKLNKPIFGGIIETHVKQPKSMKFINDILPGWFLEDNYGFADLGKIWVIWHPSVKVAVLAKSLQMITCEVLLPQATSSMVVSIIYASNEHDTRKELWSELVETTSTRVGNKPWLVLGDFNQTLHPLEHSSAPTLNVDRRTREFRECLLDSELSDILYKGNTFTWWKRANLDQWRKSLTEFLRMRIGFNPFQPLMGYLGIQISQTMHLVKLFWMQARGKQKAPSNSSITSSIIQHFSL